MEREEQGLVLLLEAMASRYGYDLRGYSPPSLLRRVRAALARTGLSDLGELRQKVLEDPNVFSSVLDDLAVRVSEMFRDPEFYRALRARVVPILRTYPLLKVWLSGCAGGEEVDSLAILLSEEGLYERAQIYATDLSPRAIGQAKQGLYPKAHLEAFAKNYAQSGGPGDFSSYYSEAYGGIAMKESLRRNVVFFEHNLVADQVFGEMQVVFCRNVLIYFGRELRGRVVTKLRQSLCPGGFLCLGSAEAMSGDTGFLDFVPGRQIFRRES